MWSPTHTQVTVLRAKNLLAKGKNGTNNCYVTIALGKEKYQTSTKEKCESGDTVDWHEECELAIPNQGNRAEIILTCLHHNSLGLDMFLGQVVLPLNEMDVYERPRAKWYKLQSKPGKEKKNKERGELEVRVAFTVKAGSLTDLSKKEKHKSSIGQIASNVGGSLLSLGAIEKRKGIKKFAKSLGSKMHISGKSKKDKYVDNDSFNGSFSSVGTAGASPHISRQTFNDADPGVISENEDEFAFDNLSHRSSGNSLNLKGSSTIISSAQSQFATLEEEEPSTNLATLPPAPPKPTRTSSSSLNQSGKVDEWESKLYGGKNHDIGSSDSLKRRSWENNRVPLNTTVELNEDTQNEAVTSTTAPNTPTLKDKNETSSSFREIKINAEKENAYKPQTLPRSHTLESVTEKEDKVEKHEKNIFSKKLKYFRKDKSDAEEKRTLSGFPKQMEERIIIGHENNFKDNKKTVEVPKEVLKKYEGKSREEIIKIAHNLENEVRSEKMKIKELEDYLDNLLLRVMETHPRILQNPYSRNFNAPTKSG